MEIDRGYLLVALVLGLAGMLLGFYMGIAADNKLQTVHVAMVLPGFVTLAIYGFVFRLWPEFKRAPLAAIPVLDRHHRRPRPGDRQLSVRHRRRPMI